MRRKQNLIKNFPSKAEYHRRYQYYVIFGLSYTALQDRKWRWPLYNLVKKDCLGHHKGFCQLFDFVLTYPIIHDGFGRVYPCYVLYVVECL